MALECLLLTGDSALLSTIRAKFSEQGIELLVRKDAASAIEFSERRHLDGFVIDCDDVPQVKEALRSIPANPANKQSVMLAIVNGRTSVSEAFELGRTSCWASLFKMAEFARFSTLLSQRWNANTGATSGTRSICPLSCSCTQGSPSGPRCGISAREALPSTLAKHCLRVC